MKKRILLLCLGFLFVVFFSGCSEASGKSNLTSQEKKEVLAQSRKLIEEKGPWKEVLPLYEKMIKFQPTNSKARQAALRYMLAVSWQYVLDRKADEALELGLALDKVIPGDYYIQNRILGAYRIYAEDAIAKKDWQTAYDYLYNKALKIRFDVEIMRTYLKLRYEMAKEALEKGKPDDARIYLNEIVLIASADENKPLFPKEKEQAEKLLKKIPVTKK